MLWKLAELMNEKPEHKQNQPHRNVFFLMGRNFGHYVNRLVIVVAAVALFFLRFAFFFREGKWK